MSIRKLLLELETGGNIRFEDEQKEELWVKECESIVKQFIKRAISKDSPKTVQIHRLSKLHNRFLKTSFEEKSEQKIQDSDPGMNMQTLCCLLNDSESDVFHLVEHGFESRNALFSNYLNCSVEKDVESTDFNRKKLKKALIVKVYGTNYTLVDSNPGTSYSSKDFPGMDGVYMEVLNSKTSLQSSECPKDYILFHHECILPLYFIEYSLEAEKNSFSSKLERLALDIAYSNKLSHSIMPNIIGSLTSKFEKCPVCTFSM